VSSADEANKTYTVTATLLDAGEYTVAFDGNGADTGDAMPAETYTEGGNNMLPDCAYTRAGYSFSDWNTQADGGGTAYTAGSLVTADMEAAALAASGQMITLYAQWQAHTITVAYQDGGGSGSMGSSTFTAGVTNQTLAANEFTRNGYEFIGWRNAAVTTELYADEAPVPAAWFVADNATVTLTALWLSLSVEAAAGSGYLPLLKVGDTGTLDAVLDVTGGLATTITWSTSDLATVSIAAGGASCTLTAEASGTATITATPDAAPQKAVTFAVRVLGDADAMASGGTLTFVQTASGYDEVHTFTANANNTTATHEFIVNRAPETSSTKALIVAGGGGGGGSQTSKSWAAGGGGAGGLRQKSAFALTAGYSYTVKVGKGGAGGTSGNITNATVGDNSSIDGLESISDWTAAGGGRGTGHWDNAAGVGGAGGSGGGGSGTNAGGNATAGQGYNGATGGDGYMGGGGGGAGGVGSAGNSTNTGKGGAGVSSDISGTAIDYAGGGGGGMGASSATAGTAGAGGVGGGGNGGRTPGNGTDGRGGGGGGCMGGSGSTTTGGRGGSGVVIVRFAFVLP
jgi:hypothetical protein